MCLVTIQGDGKFEITQSKYRLTEEQKQDDGQNLFDFCAECLKVFIQSSLSETLTLYLGSGGKIPLGFTVSKFIFSFVLRCLTTIKWKFSYPCSWVGHILVYAAFFEFHLSLQSKPNWSWSFDPLDQRFRRTQYGGSWCSWNVPKISRKIGRSPFHRLFPLDRSPLHNSKFQLNSLLLSMIQLGH